MKLHAIVCVLTVLHYNRFYYGACNFVTYCIAIIGSYCVHVDAVVISIVIISAIGVAAAMIAFVACKVICKRKGRSIVQ